MTGQRIFHIDENGHSFQVVVWDWIDDVVEEFFKARGKVFDEIDGSGSTGQNPCSERWRLENSDQVWMLLSHPDREFIEGRVNNNWVSSKEEFFRALRLMAFE